MRERELACRASPPFAALVIHRRLPLLASLLCALPLGLAAAPDSAIPQADSASVQERSGFVPEFSGESQDTDMNTGETILYKATASFGEKAYLTGDEVRYNTNTEKIRASGHVVLNFGDSRLLAEEVEYSLKDGTYTVRKPRIGRFPLYLRGEEATGDQQHLLFKDARVSYGEPGLWVPSLSAKTLTYTHSGNGSVRASSATVGIANIHFIPLPSFKQTIGAPLKSYLTVAGGYGSRLGAFLDLGVRLPVAKGLRAGVDLGYYSSRGFLFGPAAQYDYSRSPEHFVKGSLRTGYINDHGKRLTDSLGNPVPEQRSFISWEHREQIGPAFTFEGLLNYWRDSEVTRDFRRRDFYSVQVPDSYLEATYTGANYHLSLFGRFHPNAFHEAQERLPELRFDLLPTRLFEKVYQRLNLSYARLRDNPPGSNLPTLQTDRADAYYALTRNFTPREWLGATAVVGARSTHYSDTNPGSDRGTYTRNLAEFGVDAHLNASATFDYENERWGIKGLRHLVTPRVSYRYIPEASKGRAYIPSIDRRTFNTYLAPLGLGESRSIDELHSTNTLRVSLEQRLQTRDAQYGSRDLATLTLANDFLFEREAGRRKVAETHVDLAVMPAAWLRFDAYSSLDPHDFSIRELNTGLSLHDGDEWDLRLATHYLDGDLSEYGAEYTQRLNEAYSAYVRVLFDGRASRLTEHAYGLIQNLSHMWLLRYEMAFYNGPRREGSFGFRIEVDARGF